MSSNIQYDVTVSFGGGTYQYSVHITLSGGMDYSGDETYSGTYTVNGSTITMTGVLSSGTVYGSSIALTGRLSSFASQSDTITVFR